MTDKDILTPYEFKGIEFQPPSYARLTLALSLINAEQPRYSDIPAFIYACICPHSLLQSTLRDRSKFDMSFTKWLEDVKWCADDVDAATEILTSIMDSARKSVVEPIPTDHNLAPDPNCSGCSNGDYRHIIKVVVSFTCFANLLFCKYFYGPFIGIQARVNSSV